MTDVNREWNERRPDVIEAFVGNVPMGRGGEPAEIGPLACSWPVQRPRT